MLTGRSIARPAVDVGVFAGCCIVGGLVATFMAPGILAVGVYVGALAGLAWFGNNIKNVYYNNPK